MRIILCTILVFLIIYLIKPSLFKSKEISDTSYNTEQLLDLTNSLDSIAASLDSIEYTNNYESKTNTRTSKGNINTTSDNINLDNYNGNVTTMSGNININSGSGYFKSMSGNITLDDVIGADVKTMSGNVTVSNSKCDSISSMSGLIFLDNTVVDTVVTFSEIRGKGVIDTLILKNSESITIINGRKQSKVNSEPFRVPEGIRIGKIISDRDIIASYNIPIEGKGKLILR